MLENNNEEAEDYENERLADEDDGMPLAGAKQVLYVNLYRVTRYYGGPEEGGWWYDAGEPLASVPIAGVLVQQFEDVPDVNHLIPLVSLDFIREKKRLLDLFAYEKCGNISSVRGGADVRVCSEEHVARNWPETRPHYE